MEFHKGGHNYSWLRTKWSQGELRLCMKTQVVPITVVIFFHLIIKSLLLFILCASY